MLLTGGDRHGRRGLACAVGSDEEVEGGLGHGGGVVCGRDARTPWELRGGEIEIEGGSRRVFEFHGRELNLEVRR